jgi:hypothetical protein
MAVKSMKRSLLTHRCRLEDNIKMDLQEIGLEGMDWIHLVHDRIQWWSVVKMVNGTFKFHKSQGIS